MFGFAFAIPLTNCPFPEPISMWIGLLFPNTSCHFPFSSSGFSM
ncbi:hypothetical protein NT03LS_1923, partial [Listeria seeligeri FSL N1-067]